MLGKEKRGNGTERTEGKKMRKKEGIWEWIDRDRLMKREGGKEGGKRKGEENGVGGRRMG